MDSKSKLPWETAINTKANLKSEVLQEIALILGLDYSRFATKEKLIDEKLLGNRNRIAHGQFLLVGYTEYLGLHDDVLMIMQEFHDQVEDAAVKETYRIPA